MSTAESDSCSRRHSDPEEVIETRIKSREDDTESLAVAMQAGAHGLPGPQIVADFEDRIAALHRWPLKSHRPVGLRQRSLQTESRSGVRWVRADKEFGDIARTIMVAVRIGRVARGGASEELRFPKVGNPVAVGVGKSVSAAEH